MQITSASEPIRLIRAICVRKKLTTDISNLTDANQGENRDYALKGHGLHLALGIALGFSVHVIFAL